MTCRAEMSNSADERLASPGVCTASLPSPREDTTGGMSSDKDEEEESRSTVHQEDDDDEEETGKKSADISSESESARAVDDEYFRPIKKLRMAEVRPAAPQISPKPLTSFFIKDILNHKPSTTSRRGPSSVVNERGIVRPWDLGGSPSSVAAAAAAAAAARRRPRSADDDSRSDKSESDSSESPAGVAVNASPLDALFEMTSKAFQGLDANDKSSDHSRDHLNLFSNRQQPKKKRKSRTAFTNHQIFELEKRFLYQKYLSPADRDEIAQSLGLTNAQVITWFQNRRAKLKRDMEELKKDVDAAKVGQGVTPSRASLLDSIAADMSASKRDLS